MYDGREAPVALLAERQRSWTGARGVTRLAPALDDRNDKSDVGAQLHMQWSAGSAAREVVVAHRCARRFPASKTTAGFFAADL